MIVTTLKSSTLGFDCSSGLRALLGRQMFPRYLVGIPTAEMEFFTQWARLRQCDRKSFLFLAFSEKEVSVNLILTIDPSISTLYSTPRFVPQHLIFMTRAPQTF